MHEMSLVRSLLRQVGDLLLEHGGVSVETIRVQLGPLSGVERTLVEIAFAHEVRLTPCRGAELHIEEVPLTAACRDCRREFEVQQFHFVCPQCHSAQIRITGGDDVRLLEVDLETSEPCLREALDAASPPARR